MPLKAGVIAKLKTNIIGVTSSMLGAMKGVKMSGLSDKMSTIISNLRLAEIASAHRYRTMLVYVVTLCTYYMISVLLHPRS